MNEWLGLPPDYSQEGHHIDSLIAMVHWAILVLLVGWSLYLVYVLWRFRSGRQPEPLRTGPRGRFAMALVAVIALSELAVLFLVEIPLWAKRTGELPSADEVRVVRVLGEQFVWNFHYAGEDGIFGPTSSDWVDGTNPVGLDYDAPESFDDLVMINEFHLPVGEEVLFELRSKDVVHAFYLPFMRVRQDVIPGQTIRLAMTPVEVGESEIGCAQLCGLGHFRMLGRLTVESQEDFEAWYEEELAYQ